MIMAPRGKSKEMPFLDHLEEFRMRILKTLGIVLVLAIISYMFSDQVFEFLQYPLKKGAPDIKLHFFGITEAFTLRFKLSLLIGVFLGMPVLIYHLWQFVVPGLLESEVKVAFPLVILATIFFLIGASFCFFVVARYGLRYLIMTDLPPNTQPVIGLGSYFSFLMWMMIAFGSVFELPVIAFFLGRLGIIHSRMMAKGRHFAIVGILVVAAIITPPDVFSQITVSIPLYLLYEISIVVVRMTGRKEKKFLST
ncbi:MAG: twin-arginine translocase subunit TatC [candidate division Zixibacteria bacterium CG_4_9_14_3_um_filter_46_8]|nr:MAG: twin-arginine translocase subunit TatC [candidate division Zixibacteria bacterium CG_4_9_14_3_um_filter_46_8]